ncbi:MCE family protein [Rhodococcus sp. NPDC059968]|uniref:MCE family protein n=1 Tax=Rhodococcus sp. NPDC059968 TaxID=3347017 RepID=UPI00366B36F9
MTDSRNLGRTTHAALGTALIAVLAVVTAVCVGFYNGTFEKTTAIYLLTDRAGLLMEPGSDVRIRGVVVGRVAAVDHDVQGVRLTMDIDRARAEQIPINVNAEISPTTIFGRKSVELMMPEKPSTTPVSAGTILGADVTVEVNDTFATLLSVLKTVEPQKVNTTLTARATGLDGRGSQLGQVLTNLNSYLGEFNQVMPALQRDIPLAADNFGTLADVAPDLLRTIDNFSATSETVVESQTQLNAFLLSFTEFGNSGTDVVTQSGDPLIEAMDALTPTTALLADYSPQYPCFFASLNQSRRYLERAFGGGRPGLNIQATVLMGDPPYEGPNDLPVVGADNPPSCYGFPRSESSPPPGHINFNDGSHAYREEMSPADLLGSAPFADLLFGPIR